MRITISGEVGSGKSTIARMLAEKLGYGYYSVGALLRKMAKDRGLSIMDISSLAEKNHSIDARLDEEQRKLSQKENFVMDSRLGFHFIPDSFKIFLQTDIDRAAERIFGDKRSQEKYRNVSETKKKLQSRMESEQKRYMQYYGIHFPPLQEFDCVFDTTRKAPPEIVNEIMQKIKSKRTA